MAEIRLNLGCAGWFKEGWINIDLQPQDPRVRQMDVRALEFPDDHALEIYAGHVLEHLLLAEAVPALREWRRVLLPTGLLTVTVPDVVKATAEYTSGRMSRLGYQQVLYGDPDNLGDHHVGWTEATLLAAFGAAGFLSVRVVHSGESGSHLWVGDVPWQTCVQGRKE